MNDTDTGTQTRLWVDLVYVAYYATLIYVLILEHNHTGSIGMKIWDTIGRMCRTSALTIGKAGLWAETRYWHAVERSRP